MDQAGLGSGASPAGAGLNEPLTMEDRGTAIRGLMRQGMSFQEAARELGVDDVQAAPAAPPPSSPTPSGDEPSYLDLALTGGRRMLSDVATGIGAWSQNEDVEAVTDDVAGFVGPTDAQEQASSDLYADRAKRAEAGEIGNVGHLAGDVAQAVAESSPYFVGSAAAGKGAELTGRAAYAMLSPGAKKIGLGKVAEAALDAIPGGRRLNGKRILNWATFGLGAGAFGAAGYYQQGIDRAEAEGLDVNDPEVRDAIGTQAAARGALESFSLLGIFGKLGLITPKVQSGIAAFVKGGVKGTVMESGQELADMAVEDAFLNPETIKRLDEDGASAVVPWLIDLFGTREAAIAALAGATVGGTAGSVEGVSAQKFHNQKAAQEVKIAAKVLEPMGLGTQQLEELTKTREGSRMLRDAVQQISRIERARASNLRQIEQQPLDDETMTGLREQVNKQLDDRIDTIAKTIGAPKSLDDVRKERTAQENERRRLAMDRLANRGLKPQKDLSPEVVEQVANRLDTAEGAVERLQTRVEATANPERKAETQRELDEALAERQKARIDARIQAEGMTPAQALKAVEQGDKQTEAQRRREQQRAARERAIERQTEIEFPETLAPEARLRRAQDIISEAEAETRPDAGLDGKIKRLERQRRAATSPEEVDKLTNEIADLEARRGLPTPAVEAARRVLQAQGVEIPQGSTASRPAAQPAAEAGLQPAEAATGPVGTANPAGPRSALDTAPSRAEVADVASAPDRAAEREAVGRILDARGVTDPDVRQEAINAYDADRDAGIGTEVSLEAGLSATPPVEVPIKGSSGFDAPGGMAYKDLTAKLGVAKGLDKLEVAMMEWSKETGFEAGAHVAQDGTVLGVGTNEDPNILMPPAEGLNDPTVTFTHTHTSNTPFSVADVRAMLKSGQRFRAILPDGAIIEMKPLKPYDEKAFTDMFQLVRGDLADTMPRGMDFVEGAQIKQEAMLQAMEMAGLIEYVRPFRGLAQTQKEIVNATIDRNADAIARIGAGVAGRAGTAEAGQPGGATGERRAADAEEGEGGDADPESEISDLLGDPFDFRHAARDRRPSVNRQRLRELAETLHADLTARSKKGKADKGRPLINGVGSGEVTVEHIERGLQAWVDNDGYKRMHALSDVVRRMFPGKEFKLTLDDLRDATRSAGKVKAGVKYREIKPEALQAHRIALELAEKASYAGKGYIDGPTIFIRSRSGQRFRSGLVKVDQKLKDFLEFTAPAHTRFDKPVPDPKNTKKLKRDVKGNAFEADALAPARRTAEYLQANTYTLDAARIAALTTDDMISSKGLAASGLSVAGLERYRALERTPKGQWTEKDTEFMTQSGDNIKEKLVVAANKLSQLKEAYRLFVAENGPDAEVGFMYQIDNRGRIYADGQFNPQGGSAIKGIFRHKGVSLSDMVEVDASASGWQINAIMARDHIAAPELNMGRGSATAGGKKSDLYKNTIARVVETIQRDAEIDLKTIPVGQRSEAARRQRVAQTFIRVGLGPDGKLNRNAIKASVIAVNYGGTKANFQQNLRKVFQAEIDAGMFKGVINDKPWSYIGDLAYESLKTTAPHSLALQVWSIDAVSKLAKAIDRKYPPGEAPPVTFSVGLEGKVRVKKKRTVEAEGEVRNRTAATYARGDNGDFLLDADGNRSITNTSREDVVTLKAKVDTLEVNEDKVGRAVWANIVQGFDASVLHRAVERYKQMTNGAYITTNHDSFTVPPEHEAAIAAAVRESMREIMEQVDAPARIYKEVMEQAAQHGVDIDVRPFDNSGQYNMDDLMTSTPVFGDGPKGEDYIPEYADIPEDAPVLRRAVDTELPEGGGGAAAPGTSPARAPVREQGASSIADLAPEVRQAVDVANYMEQLDQPNQTLTAMQKAASDPMGEGKSLLRSLDRALLNGFQPIRSLEKKVRGDGTLGQGMESAFKAAELAVNDSGRNESLLYYGAGAFGSRMEFTAAPGTVGLRDIFKTASGGKRDGQALQHWFEYMVAQRAKELQAKGVKTPLTQKDIQTALARSNPDFVAAEKMWRDFNRANLKMVLDSGRITKEQHDAMAADDFYVPFFRTDQRLDGAAPEFELPQFARTAGGDLRARDPGIKSMKGGDKTRIANLAQNMIRNSQAMVAASMRNVAANKTFELMETAGLVKIVKGSEAKPNQNAIKRYVKGREEWVVPLDDDATLVIGALGNLQPVQLDGVKRVFNAISSTFRAGVTTTPSFIVSNLWRGMVANGLLTSGANLTPSSNTITGASKALGLLDPSTYKEFKRLSGMGDYRLGQATSGFGANDFLVDIGLQPGGVIYAGRKIFKAWEGVGMASEMADRIAAFDTMVKRGVPRDEAAYQALTVMNYSRKGGNETVRAWLSTMPFMNARLQGYARLLEGTVGKNATPATRSAALKKMLLTGLIYTAANAAVWAWNYEDEERREIYQNLPTWRRVMFMNIVLPNGFVLTLPQPFELGFVFGSIPTSVMDTFAEDLSSNLGLAPGAEDMEGAWKDVTVKVVGDMVAFSVIPQAISPFFEGSANYNTFFGSPIEARGEQDLAAELRVTNADEFAKYVGGHLGVSRITGLSPAMMAHYGSNYGGVPYAFMAGLFNTIASDVGLAPPQAATLFGENAAARFTARSLRNFVFDPTLNRDRWSEEFYAAGKEATERIRSFKATGDVAYLEGAPGSAAAYKLFNRTNSQLSDLKKAEVEIRQSENLTPQEKRAKLQAITKARNTLLQMATGAMTGAMEPPG